MSAARNSFPGGIPDSFRPLLWSLRWEDLDPWEDREDIVMAAFNEGRIEQVRWVIETYGKNEIRSIFSRRLMTEFHPESRNLASILIPGLAFRHAR